MRQFNDRVGMRPFLYVTPQLKGYDVDNPEQFEIAKALVAAGF
jgi:hypothetical protein